MKRVIFCVVSSLLLSPYCSLFAEEPVTHPAIPIKDDRLENAHRLTEKVITGAEPHGEAAFQALKELGIKTIITVDGAAPKVDLAEKYGLRYVHLPIGYDGVPVERGKELAKAIMELDGPIYIHCHHGKHRGPAAAVVACIGANSLSNADAIAAMKKLGTGENYLGLWASAKDARPLSNDEMQKLHVEYRAVSPIPPLAEAMVKVDEIFDLLTDSKAAKWSAPKDHPDVDPAHEALKLGEIYFELQRTDAHKQRPDDFKKLMKDAEARAKELETLLRAFKMDPSELKMKELDGAYSNLQNDCKACHKPYRNQKPK